MPTVNRHQLLQMLTLAKPSLSTRPFVPAMTHFRLWENCVEAYDELSAIAVFGDIQLPRGCVPGLQLLTTLGSYEGDEVNVNLHATEQAMVVSSGRSRVKLPMLPPADLPLVWPKTEGWPEVLFTPDMLTGLERCLAGSGRDQNHLALMGVTLDSTLDGCAILYASDDHTISTYATKTPLKLPAGEAVLIPSFMCRQILALTKTSQDSTVLCVGPGALVLYNDRANVMTRLRSVHPMDFDRVLNKAMPVDKPKPIPAGWDSALQRAVSIMGKEGSTCTIQAAGRELLIRARSGTGEVEEPMAFDAGPPSPVNVDPALVLRGSKHCTHMAFGQGAVLLTDGTSFQHLVAYTK